MAIRWLGFLWVAVLVLAVSCGGDDDVTPATPAGSPVGQPTPVLPVTPEPTPIITGNQFEAPTKGYKVLIPEGWVARPNFFPTATSTTDVFFGPEEADSEVRTNIGVTCEQTEEGTSFEQYVAEKRELLAAVTGRTPETQSTQVSGREAAVMAYSLEREPPVDKIDAVFAGDRCVWTVALTVTSGQVEALSPLFDEFLGSFQLLP